MRRLPFLFFVCLFVLVVGCQQQDGQPDQPGGSGFAPPEDRRIKVEQSDRYIEAAKLSRLAIIEYQTKRKDFEKKFKLSPDHGELRDTLYLKKHPDVKSEADALQKWFESLMDSVYVKATISDDEFTWVGGALGDTINREIQKKVETELNAFEKELEKEGE